MCLILSILLYIVPIFKNIIIFLMLKLLAMTTVIVNVPRDSPFIDKEVILVK